MSTASNLPKAPAIAAELRKSISEGEYRPGHQLPSARVLAVRFDAARGTVNAAMTMLIREGLVTSRPRAGWFVAEPVRQHDVSRSVLTEDQRQAAHVVEHVAARAADLDDAAEAGCPVGSPVLAVTRVEVDEHGAAARQVTEVLGPDRTLRYELPASLLDTVESHGPRIAIK